MACPGYGSQFLARLASRLESSLILPPVKTDELTRFANVSAGENNSTPHWPAVDSGAKSGLQLEFFVLQKDLESLQEPFSCFVPVVTTHFTVMSIKVYPEPLGSIFLTGLDGFVYEFPAAIANQHRVSPERIKELGHLPIVPYTRLVLPNPNQGDEVSARHYVLRDDGQYAPHSDLLYGTAVSEEDGICYTGLHFHPGGGFGARFTNDSRTGGHLT
jgi:hypothetical protein